ncbi:putative ATP-dependent RNA helicase DDX12 isoform X2, partial [Daubentonia madagascariensis]
VCGDGGCALPQRQVSRARRKGGPWIRPLGVPPVFQRASPALGLVSHCLLLSPQVHQESLSLPDARLCHCWRQAFLCPAPWAWGLAWAWPAGTLPGKGSRGGECGARLQAQVE